MSASGAGSAAEAGGATGAAAAVVVVGSAGGGAFLVHADTATTPQNAKATNGITVGRLRAVVRFTSKR